MSSKIYSSIFLLKDVFELASLESIFNNTYRDILYTSKKDKAIIDKLSDSEKYFVFSWKTQSEIEEIELPVLSQESNDSGESHETIIKFQRAIANIEYSKQKKKDGSRFLPKADRLNEIDVEVVFFERNSKIYVLILTSQDVHVQRAKKLIGLDNIEDVNSEYLLETDLFHWLVYMYDEKKGRLSESIKLANIYEFVGNDSDDANVFSGSSNYTTKLIGTKAFISNGGELKKYH